AADDRAAPRSPVAPEEAIELMRLAPGLRVELVACEPEVIDPVAVRFDARGRMWVVEMRDYPHGPPEGKPPLSKIRILEDRDGDGRYQTGTTFAENLLFATGVLPWSESPTLGAFVTLAGKVVYMEDTDGDLKADRTETWYHGFAEENPQLRANHPRLGIDGSIYIANGLRGGAVVDARRPDAKPLSISGMDFRFDPFTREFEAVTGAGQFGLTFDDFGERFVCSNRNPLKHIVIEDRYLRGNPAASVSSATHDVAAAGEASRIYPISEFWTTSNLHAGQFTAACGVCVFRGDRLGEAFYGNGFTCDPTGNLVHREVMQPRGATFHSQPAREGIEFLASTDSWFRPVNLEAGPDGALYVVDMQRAVIEHPQFMPEELKSRPDLRDGDDRGRIYRIVAEKPSDTPHPTNLAEMPSGELVKLLEHPNSWQRETAAQLLRQRGVEDVVESLQSLAAESSNPAARAQALWLLASGGRQPPDGQAAIGGEPIRGLTPPARQKVLLQAMADDHPRVREAAVRLAEPQLAQSQTLRERVVSLAMDEDPRLRFQVALSLGYLEGEDVVPALVEIAARAADDVWTRRAVSLSLKDRAAEALVRLLAHPLETTARSQDGWLALIAETAAQAGAAGAQEERLKAIQALMDVGGENSHRVQLVCLKALAEAMRRRGESLDALANELPAGTKAAVEDVFATAARVAQDRSAPDAARIEAIELSALSDESQDALAALALEEPSQSVRVRAIGAAARSGDLNLWRDLLTRFRRETPAVRSAILDGALARAERTHILLDEIAAGRISPGEIDQPRMNRLLQTRDSKLAPRVKQILADAIPADRQKVLAEYQVSLTLDSDPQRGKTIFTKHCANCHRVGDVGVDVAPDISDSRVKKPEQILTDVLQPNRAIDANFVSYSVITADGQVLTGILASETGASITLKQPEGKTVTLARDEIEELRSNGVSLMPEGLEQDIPPQDMADVIAFIKNWRYLDGRIPLGDGAKVAPPDIGRMQAEAMESGVAEWGRWGADPRKYSSWTNHSNRLVPVYAFGIALDEVRKQNAYHDAARLEKLYGRTPQGTLNPEAAYFDQTAMYDLQQQAIAAGKKHIVLVIFDGMDWQTTAAAAHYRSGRVYKDGRGSGLLFQDYRGVETDYGFFVTSPYSSSEGVDVNAQTVADASGGEWGGYDASLGGGRPWEAPRDSQYLLGRNRSRPHAVTDSASSATSLTAGIKTYNAAINVAPDGSQVTPIARRLQSERGFAIGVVTSVPISHATPACAYSNNVSRNDYQDLTRDLLGLPSIAHRREPLAGVDVLLGGGWGETKEVDKAQGANFIPGNRYLSLEDRSRIDAAHGGRYVVAERTSGQSGAKLLEAAAEQAVGEQRRLFGFFGVRRGHLPFQTADGEYDPVAGVNPAEQYTPADVAENPTLADMTRAALTVLENDPDGFWLMVEPGDVDWANHDNNLDNSIGAVLSGDDAFCAIIEWVEARDAWDDTAVIVTADHGHFLVLERPEALAH
ncbi:MAG: alkaline phosphatase, partial [Planctomycetes bacterium]|nr:alkaline phosphatase [Planctomycetota bacterium]